MKAIPLCVLAAALSGCLYAEVRAPRAYRSATPADVKAAPSDPEVRGEACARSALYLAAWGDASYAAAARKALEGRPDAVLYDVKADVRANSVLFGLYTRACTVLTGRAARP